VSDDLNPYAAPNVVVDNPKSEGYRKSYGGIGRLAYFGYTSLAAVVYQVLVMGLVSFAGGAGDNVLLLVLPILLAYLGVLMFVVAKRMINCGYSPWWCVGIIVPLVNILVGFRALCCPEGYADHKKLDTASKTTIGIIIGAFLLLVLFAVIASM